MTATAASTQRHDEPGLFAIWFPIIGPLAAWAIHLVGEAALVRSAQTHSWVIWVMHGLSAVLAAVAIAGGVIGYRLGRLGREVEGGERSGTPEGRTAFLGWLGLYSAAFNLGLILAEEAIIIWVHVHA
ncbi:MAG: hypothetical protein AB7L17_08820 [Ilumatobacteraceae bacterium]